MANGNDEGFRLDEELLSRLIFETFGDQRYTQDSPIMPDVWISFARAPRKPLDLLLTPLAGDSPSKLATELTERLARFQTDEEDDEVRLRGMSDVAMLTELATPEEMGRGKESARAAFEVAYSRSSVVAKVTFLQLVCVVVPMTDWWSKLDSIAKNYSELRPKLEKLNRDEATLARIITESAIIVNRSTWDFFRFCALVGFIAQAQKAGVDVENQEAKAGSRRHAQYKDRRKTELEKTMLELVKGDTKVDEVFDVIEAYGDIAKRIDEYPASLSENERSPKIFMITENRTASLSISESRGTVKADAANNVFQIDTGDFAWAVIDGGVDAQHPAFLDSRAVDKYLSDKKAAAQTPEAEQDYKSCAENIWRQDIPLSVLGKLSRVRETYDFTYLRRMLSLKDLPSHKDGGPAEHLAKRIRERYPAELNHLRIRTVKSREIDWTIVAPLIRVPHDDDYIKPGVGHGTHVAGILGGRWKANDNPENIDLVGICPQIRLYDLRVYNPNFGSDEFTVQYALQFVEHLNRNRDLPLIHGVNLSLSMLHKVMSFACGRTPVCDECNNLVSTGVVVVVAAGNDGYKTFKTDKGDFAAYHAASITDPGNAEDVITVGATHRSHPHTYGVSYFSSRGPTGDGRRKPDLVAPGEKITAPVLNCRVQRMDGTSMAAPHVSGAAALLMARHRELIGNPRRIKEILCRTATDLGRESHFQGAGMIDILRALQSV